MEQDQYRMNIEESAQEAADALGENISLSFLPKELVAFCYGAVKSHHERYGYKDLSQHIMQKDAFVCILMHNDLRELMRAVLWCKKISISCFVASGILVAVSLAWNEWFAMGLIPLFTAATFVGRRYQEWRLMIAARLLTLEMISGDFIGLSKYLPTLCRTARRKVELCFSDNRTTFLDIYIPGRKDADYTELEALLRGRLIPAGQ